MAGAGGAPAAPGSATKRSAWVRPKLSGATPKGRWSHTSAWVDGQMFVYGGLLGEHFGELLVLDTATWLWSAVKTCGDEPGPRDSHTWSVVGRSLVLIGGTDQGGAKLNSVHVLDLDSYVWETLECTGSLPPPRESHSCAVVGEKIVMFGGNSVSSDYLNDVYVLDLPNRNWRRIESQGDVPCARDSHVSCTIGDQIVVFGGDCGERYLDDVFVLDFETGVWRELPISGRGGPGRRAGHAATAVGDKVVVFGGCTQGPGDQGEMTFFNDTWVLDIFTAKWQLLPVDGELPHSRFAHTTECTNDGKLFVYGGCGIDDAALEDVYVLELELSDPVLNLAPAPDNQVEEAEPPAPEEAPGTSTAAKTSSKASKGADDDAAGDKSPTQDDMVNAYQLFSTQARTQYSQQHPEIEADELERIIDSQWSRLTDKEREPYIAAARHGVDTEAVRRAEAARAGLAAETAGASGYGSLTPQAPNLAKRPRPKKPDIILGPDGQPIKRKRGRPPKVRPENAVAVQGGEINPTNTSVNALMAKVSTSAPGARTAGSLPRMPIVEKDIVNKKIEGVVDGVFESVYFMTAVAEGQVFRGILIPKAGPPPAALQALIAASAGPEAAAAVANAAEAMPEENDDDP